MATAQELWESLENFAQLFNDNGPLKQMIKGWDRVALVSPTDLSGQYTVKVEKGYCTVTKSGASAYDLEISATAELLTSMFFGEVAPTQPYMDGTLICRGSEDDLMKLDFVTAMIWE